MSGPRDLRARRGFNTWGRGSPQLAARPLWIIDSPFQYMGAWKPLTSSGGGKPCGPLFQYMGPWKPPTAFRCVLTAFVVVPRRVRMSQPIPAGWYAVPNLSEISFVKAQAVANVVQAQRVRQLGEDHCHNMARFRERPRLDFVLGFQFFDKFCRNVLDNLTKHRHIMFLRTHVCLHLVAKNKVAWVLFLSSYPFFMGYLCFFPKKSAESPFGANAAKKRFFDGF